MIIEITKENFNEIVLKSGIPVLVDFYKSGCGPCEVLLPILEKILNDYKGKVCVYKVNIEEENIVDLYLKYRIRNIPTVLFFNRGIVVDKYVGQGSEKVYIEKLDSLINMS